MTARSFSLLAAAVVVTGITTLGAAPARADLSSSPKVAATQVALRDLWTGHIFWVRNVSLATMNKDTAAAKAAEDQVVANAKQIAGAIEPFYGKAASDKLFTLLAGHWAAVKAHIDATAKGDAKAQQAAIEQAAKNGDEIATFLSGANPNLPKGTLVALLTAHVGHHVTQNQQLHDKKYADEAKTWDAMRAHMNVIADALGDGIAKQFPAKF
jgi:hypothetical protein